MLVLSVLVLLVRYGAICFAGDALHTQLFFSFFAFFCFLSVLPFFSFFSFFSLDLGYHVGRPRCHLLPASGPRCRTPLRHTGFPSSAHILVREIVDKAMKPVLCLAECIICFAAVFRVLGINAFAAEIVEAHSPGDLRQWIHLCCRRWNLLE